MLRLARTHGAGDRRNCLGYAIDEISIGTQSAGGEFYDLVRHTADQDQTATICSSIDPWHEPSDQGPTSREQVGLDLFYTSGYTRGRIGLMSSSPLRSKSSSRR